MTTATDISRLQSELSLPHTLTTDLDGLAAYFSDATEYSNRPLAILMAECVADVITAVNFCRTHGLAVTPRGAGTGLSGGAVPSKDALVISTERIDSIEILPQEQIAICGPGVITKDLQDQAALLGLTYPPDPASYAECTLGGNVAEGAGGLRCKRFGVTKDYILGLEAVTGEGKLLKTGLFNDHRGFCIGDMLIASEGTLAIVTSIAVQLVPLPARGHTVLVAFESPVRAAQAVSDITTSGMIPTVLEYIDGDTVCLANEYQKTDGIDNAAAVLLIETSDTTAGKQTAEIKRICQTNACSYLRIEKDAEKAEVLWEVRRNISRAAKELSVAKVSEDVAVPNSKFAELVQFVAQLNRVSAVRINSYGHAGDGNLHVNLLSSTGSAEDMITIDNAAASVIRKALDLGGTVSGEHGIGLAKREYLQLEFDTPTLSMMHTIKDIFDPDKTLNPEKMLSRKK